MSLPPDHAAATRGGSGSPTTRDARRHRQRGQAMVEYALALAMIALAFIVGAQLLRSAWSMQLALTANALSSQKIPGVP